MIVDLILVCICLSALFVGSLTDLQRREVPNWINYGLIIVVIFTRLLYSIFTQDITPFFFAIFGLLFGYSIGAIMYYTGQWGGGDAKMLMGLGAAFATYTPIAFNPDYATTILELFIQNEFLIQSNILFLPILVLNIFLFGAIYGLVWMITLLLRNFKKCIKEYRKLRTKYKLFVYIAYAQLLLITIGFLFTDKSIQLIFTLIPVTIFMLAILSLFVKSVEKTCMIQKMNVSDLTEGEWVIEDVTKNNTYICGPKDLGVSLEQIELLKKHNIKSVTVKIGIPFIPAFLLGFIFTIIVGNPLVLILFFI